MSKAKAVTLTVTLPKTCSKILEEMIAAGLYSTKSEAVRDAVLSLINSYADILKGIERESTSRN
jgi:Arc/MetJ-type ribon-helix-helix transcriptional regulator